MLGFQEMINQDCVTDELTRDDSRCRKRENLVSVRLMVLVQPLLKNPSSQVPPLPRRSMDFNLTPEVIHDEVPRIHSISEHSTEPREEAL
jgi:hypothetical protein